MSTGYPRVGGSNTRGRHAKPYDPQREHRGVAEVVALRMHVAACLPIHQADQDEIARLREGRPLEVIRGDHMVELVRLRAEVARLKAGAAS